MRVVCKKRNGEGLGGSVGVWSGGWWVTPVCEGPKRRSHDCLGTDEDGCLSEELIIGTIEDCNSGSARLI